MFYDKRGKLWMTYGSYSGGIFILRMDETTGKPMPGQGYGKHLAGGDHAPIEGSYILYSPETRYYYLFVSFGGFAATDGYNIRIARSRNPDGPYLDAEGHGSGRCPRQRGEHRAVRREADGRLQVRGAVATANRRVAICHPATTPLTTTRRPRSIS